MGRDKVSEPTYLDHQASDCSPLLCGHPAPIAVGEFYGVRADEILDPLEQAAEAADSSSADRKDVPSAAADPIVLLRDTPEDRELLRGKVHNRVCSIEMGILTHVHEDYGRVEDIHPWRCERITNDLIIALRDQQP